jgi:hypothetical protein
MENEVLSKLTLLFGFGLTFAIYGLVMAVCLSFTFTLFKIMSHLFTNRHDNDVLTLRYPVVQAKFTPRSKETLHGNNDSVSEDSSAFFSDVDGVDLEYRGVGVAEDRRAAAGVGAAVPKGG